MRSACTGAQNSKGVITLAFRLTALDLQRCYSSATQDAAGPLPDFRGEWLKASADDKDSLFQREVALLDESYKQLGLIGELFIASFAKTGCREIRSPDDKQTPIFQGHHFKRGHQNEILYGGWCFDNREKFHDSSNHERAHAIQHASSAISHAIPYNGHRFKVLKPDAGVPVGALCRLVLTPHAYMVIEELKERGAYTMQKVLSDLRAPSFDPKIHLGKPLQDYAAQVLEKWDVAGSQPVISHLTHYRQNALRNYENMMIQADDTPYDRDVIHVTFDASDIAALGNICGLTLFGDKTDDMSRWSATPLSTSQQQWADELTVKAGADKPVPFRAALAAIGFTPLQYLAASRGPLITAMAPSISTLNLPAPLAAANDPVTPGPTLAGAAKLALKVP